VSAHDASSDTPHTPHVQDDGSPVSPLYPQKNGGEFSRQILIEKITPNDVWNQPSVFTQATSARRTLTNVMTFRRQRFLGRQTTRTHPSLICFGILQLIALANMRGLRVWETHNLDGFRHGARQSQLLPMKALDNL